MLLWVAPAALGYRAAAADEWPLERLRLRDGRSLAGLVASADDVAVELVEIRRPQGKPMYLVVRPIERSAIASIERLDDSKRRELEQRIGRFKNRARIEARRMESVALTPVVADGIKSSRYQGRWFQLDSSADAETTRRSIVRLEQMFGAFRQVLPAQDESRKTPGLRIRLFGTTEQYEDNLRRQNIPIRNPAYYDMTHNLVVTGSDVNHFAERLAAAERRHAELRRELDQQKQKLPEQLKQLKKQLTDNGGLPDNWGTIVKAAHQKLASEQEGRKNQIATAERKNRALLDEIIEQMLRRLYHEAFHAYLENYVYDSREHDVPRWLNEGLAQIFEAGLLEADTLRIDAPDADSLAELKRDLAGSGPLPLVRLLSAEQNSFLVPHRSDADAAARRHYLYSWGLAYYLTFHKSLLGTKALDAYVARSASGAAPQARFEHLVGMPLAEFERQWREEMLKLK